MNVKNILVSICCAWLLTGCGFIGRAAQAEGSKTVGEEMGDLSDLSDEELQDKLSPMQYKVARCSGTEPVETEEAIVAAGCFWGVEQLFREMDGVLDTDVGYAGGTVERPSYHDVSSGRTGSAEAVRITFNPRVVRYDDVLRYFFRLHDPTTLNRQHNDVGTQYRSAIFPVNELQKNIARMIIDEIDARGDFSDPVVTELILCADYWPAEEYHQDYLVKNPGGYMCHVLRDDD
ncbi:MAG: peptide-methionine (S)-S-oxide reductase MsrA [Thermoanaerobaculales bacterium]|nr:peptide-methionine (S)-S-oxide reductase MsrA [Thermoanaerobaculales bacterium]